MLAPAQINASLVCPQEGDARAERRPTPRCRLHLRVMRRAAANFGRGVQARSVSCQNPAKAGTRFATEAHSFVLGPTLSGAELGCEPQR
jgi:hypothetical protein